MYTYLKQLVLGAFLYDGWRAPSTPQAETLVLPIGKQNSIVHPGGPYDVAIHVQELIDYSRLDPWASLDSGGPVNRVVMMSTYYPTAVKDPNNEGKPPRYLMPYMPDLTAAIYDDDVFSNLGINGSFSYIYSAAREEGAMLHVPGETFPVIMMSTGGGTTRFYYTALAEKLASTGYIVACIDHSHDSLVVELLNHTLLHGRIPLPHNHTQRMLLLDTRVNDTIFALDELSKSNLLVEHFSTSDEAVNVSRVGMVGHSLGGATMATTMLRDSRIAAGVSLDGPFFGPEQETGLDNPYLVMGAEGHDSTEKGWWSSWRDVWPKLRAWKRQLNVKGSSHASFSDIPLILDILNVRKDLPDDVRKEIGTIGGYRMLEIQGAYVAAFFDKFLKERNSKLLDGETDQFPEVDFIM